MAEQQTWIDRMTPEQKQQFCKSFEAAIRRKSRAEYCIKEFGSMDGYTEEFLNRIARCQSIVEEAGLVYFEEWT